MAPTPRLIFVQLLEENRPQALAWITGNNAHPGLSGLVKFYDTPYGGILIESEVFGLPNISMQNTTDFYAMHIHQNGDCSDNFSKTGEHYSPTVSSHPNHAGDLLPLFGNQGYSWSVFYDKRLHTRDILGRSVIIHSSRDDFTSQPSGDSGEKIGCGVIRSSM